MLWYSLTTTDVGSLFMHGICTQWARRIVVQVWTQEKYVTRRLSVMMSWRVEYTVYAWTAM